MKTISFAKAINEALVLAMTKDSNMLTFGLGVPDPKAIFGTTSGLQEKFGEQRVFDIPCSENAMTGIAIGAALNKVRSIFIHQRIDFFLLAFDQLINNAAKWHYMFDGACNIPITIRLIIGRGWGQGPTHSQSLQSLFAHIPGLKVVAPSQVRDAKGLLLASIFDPNPVLFLEHRWLHDTQDKVPETYFELSLNKAEVIKKGEDLTIVSYSLMALEALKAASILEKQNMSIEVIDLKSISPLDMITIFQSIKKTGRILALDLSHENFSVASEVLAKVSQHCFKYLKTAPKILALPDTPSPTSFALTKTYYKNANDIIHAVLDMLKKQLDTDLLFYSKFEHDVPGDWFKGPF